MNKKASSWFHAAAPIAAIFAFRMLGLFMLIPIFTMYAPQLHAATPALIGIALGSYGLSQGLLQIPFGLLSDRYGRKPILTIGLILFAAGSIIGACSHSIYSMIFARTLQGAGAIGSVLIALLADTTQDKERVKAMAVIGITIGLSFSLAMIISPVIAHLFGLSGIFTLTTLLALLGLLFLHTVVPVPPKTPLLKEQLSNRAIFMRALKNKQLQRLNIGIFCQHMILTSTFFAVPLILQRHIALEHLSQQWHFYLPLMIGSFVGMLPLIVLAEKKRQMKTIFLASIALTGFIQLLLAWTSQYWLSLCIEMFAYFVAFNTLEASLPSMVSRHASLENKGTAMGIYSSSQFLGIFAGGLCAGLLFQWAHEQGIFLINCLIACLWLLSAWHIQPNAYQLSLEFSYEKEPHDLPELENRLRQLPGVLKIAVDRSQKTIQLLVDKSQYQEGKTEEIIKTQISSTQYL